MPVLKKIEQHKLLFDTHVLLWYVARDKSLQANFLKIVDNAEEGSILISPMTFWEIGMLVEKKRITLSMDISDWTERLLAHSSIYLASLTPEVAILSSRLPFSVHGDPVDRILIATANITHAVLVTSDSKILEFGKNHFISTYCPTKAS